MLPGSIRSGVSSRRPRRRSARPSISHPTIRASTKSWPSSSRRKPSGTRAKRSGIRRLAEEASGDEGATAPVKKLLRLRIRNEEGRIAGWKPKDLALLAGLALLGALILSLLRREIRGKGDLVVCIELPRRQRGTFSVRLSKKRESARHAGRRQEGSEPSRTTPAPRPLSSTTWSPGRHSSPPSLPATTSWRWRASSRIPNERDPVPRSSRSRRFASPRGAPCAWSSICDPSSVPWRSGSCAAASRRSRRGSPWAAIRPPFATPGKEGSTSRFPWVATRSWPGSRTVPPSGIWRSRASSPTPWSSRWTRTRTWCS